MTNEVDGNLFSRLFRYRPREGMTPEENFLTEAYAGVLESDPDAGAAVLTSLFGTPISRDFELVTQAHYGPNRPDMEFRDKQTFAFQENKVDADFRTGQLTDYRDLLEKQGAAHASRRLVTCTRWSEPPDSHPVGYGGYRHISWPDVYKAVKEQLDLSKVDKTAVLVWRHFLNFLKVQGMAPFSGIKHETFETMRKVRAVQTQISQLLDEIVRHLLATYALQVDALESQASGRSNPYVFYNQCLTGATSRGNLVLMPEILFESDGMRFMLSVRGSSSSAILEDIRDAKIGFVKYGKNNLDKTVCTIDRPPEDQLEPKKQIELINNWYDKEISWFVARGFVQLKAAPVSAPSAL